MQENEQTKLVRRLIFAANRGLVQSETLLKLDSSAVATKALRAGKKGKGKAGTGRESQLANWEGLKLDHGLLSMAYHNHIVAGFVLGRYQHTVHSEERMVLVQPILHSICRPA